MAPTNNELIGSIDFGMVNTRVAFMELGRPKVALNSKNSTTTPTVMHFRKDGTPIIGAGAAKFMVIDPANTIIDFKVGLMNGMTYTSPTGQSYTADELATLFLKVLREEVETVLGKKLGKVVLTCPTDAKQAYRETLKTVANKAGFEVVGLRNESEAVGLAYDFDRLNVNGNILVVDIGGATCDVSLVEKQGNSLDMRAGAGDNHLGGRRFDDVLLQYVSQQFADKHGFNLHRKLENHARVLEQVIEAKHSLSEVDKVVIPLSAEGHALDLEVSRETFNQLIAEFVERALTLVKSVLASANLKPGDVSFLVLNGGSSVIPLFEQKMVELVGKKPVSGVNRQLAVVIGSTLDAARKTGAVVRDENSQSLPDISVKTRTIHGLGLLVEDAQGRKNYMMIPAGTVTPYKFSQTFTTKYDDQTSVSLVLLQGNTEDVSQCTPLVKEGEHVLSGIAKMARGVPQILVAYQIDESELVAIDASEKYSGVSTKFAVQAKGVTE